MMDDGRGLMADEMETPRRGKERGKSAKGGGEGGGMDETTVVTPGLE